VDKCSAWRTGTEMEIKTFALFLFMNTENISRHHQAAIAFIVVKDVMLSGTVKRKRDVIAGSLVILCVIHARISILASRYSNFKM
jgi:hypothetical protein